jgi:hypothetical protein
MDKKRCNGCRDDFYNGKNPFDVKECWLLDKAKLIRRVAVHVDQRPPWKQKAQWTPHCYSMERYIFVAPDNSSCK